MADKQQHETPQIDKFRDLARELECDDDEERFAERVKRIVRAPKPPENDPKV